MITLSPLQELETDFEQGEEMAPPKLITRPRAPNKGEAMKGLKMVFLVVVAMALVAGFATCGGDSPVISECPECPASVQATPAAVNVTVAPAPVEGAVVEKVEELNKPMRYMRRQRGNDFEIVPQAWVQGQSNCRTTQGSVVVCSAAWQGYADLVTIRKPMCGVAKKSKSECATTAEKPAESKSAESKTSSGGTMMPPAATTSGAATPVTGGAR